MEACADRDELFRDPVGRWMPTGSGLFWCHSPTLCGMAVWGRPGAADTRGLLHVLEGYRHLAPRFDVLQDASAVDGIDADALAVLLDWLRDHTAVMRDHVRTRVGIIPTSLAGLALAGIGPALELASAVTLVTTAREGFRLLLPVGGDALCDEVERLVETARRVTPLVLALRSALAGARGDLGLAAAAVRIGTSARSLQRQLAETGVSFRTEQADARFHAVEELLRTDDKLSAIASHVGLSDDGLILLVRARTGLTPGELRRRLRDG